MRIVADENIPFVKDAFSNFGEVVLIAGRKISRSDLIDAEMLLVRSVTKVTSELLAGTPVKFVATATIGVDHIDVDYLQKQGIEFAYAPGSNADSVAQYIIAALFELKKKYRFQLEKQTLGIIGAGNIGSRLHRLAQILGMRTMLCDPPRKRSGSGDFFLPFNEVVSNADIITFHVPLITCGDDCTLNMVNDAFFKTVKKGAILINTSRGKVVDEASLHSHIKSLGGLVLDVWKNEPSIDKSLMEIADIATPHIAGYSFDGKVRGTEAIYKAACTWCGVMPRWSANPLLSVEKVMLTLNDEDDDQLSSAILQAYPVQKDDAQLRHYLTLETSAQAAYFDELRKKYPKRMEFSHYAIENKGACPVEIQKKLEKLGFGGNACDQERVLPL